MGIANDIQDMKVWLQPRPQQFTSTADWAFEAAFKRRVQCADLEL
jgi:hypothetical protein